jgi:hypothetical protein
MLPGDIFLSLFKLFIDTFSEVGDGEASDVGEVGDVGEVSDVSEVGNVCEVGDVGEEGDVVGKLDDVVGNDVTERDS